MKLTFFIQLTGLLLFGLSSYTQTNPNVVVILADDIGVGDISHYRKKHSDNIIVSTPTLDKLATEGMVFTNAYSPAALCAPSRYAVMTGNNCYRSYMPWGVWGSYLKSPYKATDLTLGKLMKNAGYTTAFFGKWGTGMDFYKKDDKTKIYRAPRKKIELDVDVTQIAAKGPKDNGFDYSITFASGIQNVPYVVYENEVWMPLKKDSKIDFISHEKMNRIGVKIDKSEGLGDSNWDPHIMGPLLVNKTVQFIEKAPKDKPFFIYYASLAVHVPHAPAVTLNGKKIAKTTPSKHLDKVKELDVQMEMIVNALKEKGVYKNTLFIFTSDNGGLRGSETIASGHRSNDIYRGGKNAPHEGGIRVPLIMTWPEKIKPSSNADSKVVTLDIMGTLADITNQTLTENQGMDSASLLPILNGKTNKKVHPYLMLQSGTGREGIIIKDQWKLIVSFDKKDKTDATRKPIALFDLSTNIKENERDNLIDRAKYSSTVNALFELYNRTRDNGISTKL